VIQRDFPYSAFGVRRSVFGVRCSVFGVLLLPPMRSLSNSCSLVGLRSKAFANRFVQVRTVTNVPNFSGRALGETPSVVPRSAATWTLRSSRRSWCQFLSDQPPSKSGGTPPHSKTQARILRWERRPRCGVRRCSAALAGKWCNPLVTCSSGFEVEDFAKQILRQRTDSPWRTCPPRSASWIVFANRWR
jgi:hypothetical protein